MWELALGSYEVPIVVGVNAHRDGFVTCAHVYWEGEPDEPLPLVETGEFIVSIRPGKGTAPTEGDIARWAHWSKTRRPPRDWLIADGVWFRSVPHFVEALRQQSTVPEQQEIAGDWWDLDPDEVRLRNEIRAKWPETVRTNKRLRKS